MEDSHDIAVRYCSSPLGELRLLATRNGLVAIAFPDDDVDELTEPIQLPDDEDDQIAQQILDQAVTELTEYFAGQRRSFTVSLDTQLLHDFRGQVQLQLAQIGYGSTQTYKQIAEQLGKPGASRAVGSACATNPLPIVLPCHRVLRSDGDLGGYRGGLEAKRRLLDLESAHIGDV